jgi:hypothetical protein
MRYEFFHDVFPGSTSPPIRPTGSCVARKSCSKKNIEKIDVFCFLLLVWSAKMHTLREDTCGESNHMTLAPPGSTI